MSFVQDLIQSIAVLVLLIFCGTALRSVKVLREDQSAFFARIVTSVTLPAVIFKALSLNRIEPGQVLLAVSFIFAELLCFAVSWAVSGALKLEAPRKGAFIMVSMFGSSAFLGYPIVKGAFSGDGQALADAVMISELGVGSLIFTLGVIISMYYGSGGMRPKEAGKVVKDFLSSPVFLAIALGTFFSFFPLPAANPVVKLFYRGLDLLTEVNTVMVALAIGLMLHVPKLKNIILLAAFACLIKLILQPLFAAVPAYFLPIAEPGGRILVLEAAMPSAALGAVFAKRYGCDGKLASILAMCTILLSVVTIVVVMMIV